MNSEDWKKLGFDPKKDGYWATADRIKKRMEEQKAASRKIKLYTLGVILISSLIFGFIMSIFL